MTTGVLVAQLVGSIPCWSASKPQDRGNGLGQKKPFYMTTQVYSYARIEPQRVIGHTGGKKGAAPSKFGKATRWLSWYGVGLASADRLPVVVRIPAGPLGSLKCDPPKGNGRGPQKSSEQMRKHFSCTLQILNVRATFSAN